MTKREEDWSEDDTNALGDVVLSLIDRVEAAEAEAACTEAAPTKRRIPADRLDALRRLAVAYYEARHALAVEFLDPWIDPATYTVDGVLDMDAYRQALIDMEAYTEEPEMKAIAKTPTAMEPHNVWAVQMFGVHNFEARRRLHSVETMEEGNYD